MAITLTDQVIKNVIKKVIRGDNHRGEIVSLINADFLQHVIDFFKKIVELKLANEGIEDWYKESFMNSDLSKNEIVWNSGLNVKTVNNIYGTTRKEIAIEAAHEHYDSLFTAISDLIDGEEDLALTLTLTFNGVSVELTINETLIVINALAVKRAALRGGAWSSMGKQVENALMVTLCKMFSVSGANYCGEYLRDAQQEVDREVDFFLIDDDGERYKCEVKLMGKGNPESADAIFARDSRVFVADTLSDQNKAQSDRRGVFWVALNDEEGYKRMSCCFEALRIPYLDYTGDLGVDLDLIVDSLFEE